MAKAKTIPDTEFADDIALLTNTVRQPEELIQEAETVLMGEGLRIIGIQAKYVVENIKKIMNVVGKLLDLVEDYLYLVVKI